MSTSSQLAALGVHADASGLHLLPPEQRIAATELHTHAKDFLAKTKAYAEMIEEYKHIMDSRAKVVEEEKLRAIGLSNRVDSEPDVRKRKQIELQSMVHEKKAELERLNAHYESLMRIDSEQKALIDRLQNNEV